MIILKDFSFFSFLLFAFSDHFRFYSQSTSVRLRLYFNFYQNEILNFIVFGNAILGNVDAVGARSA